MDNDAAAYHQHSLTAAAAAWAWLLSLVVCCTQLALKLHPDKNKAHKADEAFKLLSRAFSCLSDPSKRAYYDRCGESSTLCLRWQLMPLVIDSGGDGACVGVCCVFTRVCVCVCARWGRGLLSAQTCC